MFKECNDQLAVNSVSFLRNGPDADCSTTIMQDDAMKILQVIHGYPMMYNAGSEVYTQTLCQSLSEKNEVFVFSREGNPVDDEGSLWGYRGRSSDLRVTKFETFDIRPACLEKPI
jgi:hypothetical protein